MHVLITEILAISQISQITETKLIIYYGIEKVRVLVRV
jgi:hypothetical protein